MKILELPMGWEVLRIMSRGGIFIPPPCGELRPVVGRETTLYVHCWDYLISHYYRVLGLLEHPPKIVWLLQRVIPDL